MIYVDKARCTGCAACMGLCPTGAIAIEDGVAVIAENLCNECGECLEVCPQRAIILVETVSTGALQPAARRATEIVRPLPQPVASPLGQQAIPAAQAALLWAGRELLPRLADLALGWLDRRTAGQTSVGPAATGSRWLSRPTAKENRAGGGMRRRARRRGGRAGR